MVDTYMITTTSRPPAHAKSPMNLSRTWVLNLLVNVILCQLIVMSIHEHKSRQSDAISGQRLLNPSIFPPAAPPKTRSLRSQAKKTPLAALAGPPSHHYHTYTHRPPRRRPGESASRQSNKQHAAHKMSVPHSPPQPSTRKVSIAAHPS